MYYLAFFLEITLYIITQVLSLGIIAIFMVQSGLSSSLSPILFISTIPFTLMVSLIATHYCFNIASESVKSLAIVRKQANKISIQEQCRGMI